jgi:hypothetical protein
MWCKDIKRWFHTWVSRWNGVKKRERKKYNKKQKLFIKEGHELQGCLWFSLWIRSWNNRGTLIIWSFDKEHAQKWQRKKYYGEFCSLMLKSTQRGLLQAWQRSWGVKNRWQELIGKLGICCGSGWLSWWSNITGITRLITSEKGWLSVLVSAGMIKNDGDYQKWANRAL